MTKEESAAMPIYALGIIALLAWLSNLSKEKTEKQKSFYQDK